MGKAIAGALIFAAFVILGFSLNDGYRKRVVFLNDFIKFINFSKGEIDYYQIELSDLIDKFCENNDSEFCRLLRENDKNSFGKTEEKLLVEYINGISSLDRASLADFINYTLEKAEKELTLAENNVRLKGNMYKKLLPLVGLGLFIVVM